MECIRIEPLVDCGVVDRTISDTVGPDRSIPGVDDVPLRDREWLTGPQRDDTVGLPAGEDRTCKSLGQESRSRYIIDEAGHHDVRLIKAYAALLRKAIVLVLICVRVDPVTFV